MEEGGTQLPDFMTKSEVETTILLQQFMIDNMKEAKSATADEEEDNAGKIELDYDKLQGQSSDGLSDMELTREDAKISAGVTPLDLIIKDEKRSILDKGQSNDKLF